MIDTVKVQALLETKSMLIGVFDVVFGHEPKSAPGHGANTAIFLDLFRTVQTSGLDQTSFLLQFKQQIYIPMLTEPQDSIDPAVLDATQQVVGAYCGDFTLGGGINLRCVDLFGAFGNDGLYAKAGYRNQDGKLYRAMEITLPLIIDDVFDQEVQSYG